jgi:uncharacterized membrane protein
MPDQKSSGGLGPVITAGLANGAKGLASAMGKKIISNATERIGATTDRLTDYASNGGGPGLMSAITGRGGNEGGAKDSAKDTNLKVTNIVEHIDVGVPIDVAYNQWTQFTDFPKFMKKVESVEQESEEKLKWKVQILWSHRSWESTIIEQVPDRRIVWQSEGDKGSVDGAVTFHELAPELTRIVLNLQYYPQGFFERTGNIWRAQGRRARLELKHFVRHLMNEAVLHPEEVRGWRGEIHDGEVVKDDETARAEEERAEGEDEPAGGEDESAGSEDERAQAGDGGQRRRSSERRDTERRDTARAPRRTGGPEGRPAGRPARRSEEPRGRGRATP